MFPVVLLRGEAAIYTKINTSSFYYLDFAADILLRSWRKYFCLKVEILKLGEEAATDKQLQSIQDEWEESGVRDEELAELIPGDLTR